MKRFYVEIDTPEWSDMWDILSVIPINHGVLNPEFAFNNNHCWQYLGSELSGHTIAHVFCHPLHPKTQDTQIVSIEATEFFLIDAKLNHK